MIVRSGVNHEGRQHLARIEQRQLSGGHRGVDVEFLPGQCGQETGAMLGSRNDDDRLAGLETVREKVADDREELFFIFVEVNGVSATVLPVGIR